MSDPVAPPTADARRAFERQRWSAAYDALAAADAVTPLAPHDLDLLMAAAYLTGRDVVGDEIAARAYRAHLSGGDRPAAARSGFWLTIQLLLRGAELPSAGWHARAQACLDQDEQDCAERGYLLIPVVLAALRAGELRPALRAAEDAVRCGERFGDPDLLALGRLARGQVLVALGRAADGLAALDGAMVAATAGDLSAMVAGIVYCAVIAECHRVLDLRRAQQWTAALSHWCDGQPDLAPYRGQCLVHRSELMMLHGSWPDALDEASRACERLADTAAAGDAYYQLAEVHRVRGEYGAAREAYRQASRWLPSGQPGTALLWLADGRPDAAAAAIRRALAEPTGHVARPRLLAAAVEILAGAEDAPARAEPPMSSGSGPTGWIRRGSGRWRCTPTAWPGSRRGTSRERSGHCARPGRPGDPSMRRTRPRGSDCRSGWHSACSANRTPRRWNSTPRAGCSSSSVPARTPRGRGAWREPAARPACSARARPRCSGSWHRGGRTGRSPPTSS